MPGTIPTAMNSAHYDAQHTASIIGVQGTLGTADTGGTAATLPVGVDPSTGALYVNNLGGNASNLGTIGTLGLVDTVTTVSNLTNGSIVVTAGTMRPDGRTTQNILSYGTQFAFSAGTQGTIIGSASVGAGTYLWLSDLSLINPNGTCLCVVSFGTAQSGTNVLYRGILGTQSAVGLEKSFSKAVNAGMTNQDLVFSTGGAGTVDVSVSYFISA